mmetsp:Transcript_20544/g.29484  ORF Transcript_20544/g.29484 Transcript_20544/m.29484 type:complete len:231 (-) Transcript_20544:2931-3623(-)
MQSDSLSGSWDFCDEGAASACAAAVSSDMTRESSELTSLIDTAGIVSVSCMGTAGDGMSLRGSFSSSKSGPLPSSGVYKLDSSVASLCNSGTSGPLGGAVDGASTPRANPQISQLGLSMGFMKVHRAHIQTAYSAGLDGASVLDTIIFPSSSSVRDGSREGFSVPHISQRDRKNSLLKVHNGQLQLTSAGTGVGGVERLLSCASGSLDSNSSFISSVPSPVSSTGVWYFT